MSKAAASRVPWLDANSDAPVIDEHATRLATFMDAVADGKISARELADQEARLVSAMKKVEPELSDALHADVTVLLCELTAYNIMKVIHEMAAAAPRTRFRG